MDQHEGKPVITFNNCDLIQPQKDPKIAELLARNQKLVSKDKRFQTDSQPFNKFYQKWDALQDKMRQKPMERFIQLITQRYNEKKAPLSIVDVGCGYGRQAYDMKKRLEANGVEIEKFYGYDVSADLIQIAKEKYGSEPKMGYFKKNLDTQFKDVAEFDAVVSFIALHWVNDIKATAQSIARSLKPKGLFLTIIELDLDDFHQLRVKFINTSKWAQCFSEEERKVAHSDYDKQIYLQTFSKLFTTHFVNQTLTPYQMSHQRAVQFFGNWIQEVRHVIKDVKEEPKRQAIIRAFTSDFIHSFPLGMKKTIIKNEDGSVIFCQRFLEYEGTVI